MKKKTRRVLFGITAVFVAILGAGIYEFALSRGRTSRIEDPRGVSALEKIRLGGADQWILVRGRDRAKPVLLFLHGGPGMPAMFLAHVFQPAWEKDFVVVHWDRRGAGKSYAAGRRPGALTVRRTLEDAFELTRLLRERFKQDRIHLVGHSWGSYLGLLAVREHPEYYAAFIGTGQLAGTRAEVRAFRLDFLRRAARERDDRELLARIAGDDAEAGENDLFRYGGELAAARSFWPILKAGLGAREYTLRDVLNVKKGADLVDRGMVYDVAPKPLEGEVPAFDVPVFFFLGRHDLNTPSPLAAEYLARLAAPLKGVVWFEASSHFPFFEEPERFCLELIKVQDAVEGRAKTDPPAIERHGPADSGS